MKFLGYDNALCLSPHPDDVEFSMSGTIKKYKDTTFTILYLSKGTITDPTSDVKRHDESRKFWEEFGDNNVRYIFIDLNIETCHTSTLVTELDGYIDMYKPNVIFGPSRIDSHFEHIKVSECIPAITRKAPISIIEYKSPSTLDEWSPNLIVSLDDASALSYKCKHLRNFASQQDSSYFSNFCLYTFHTNYQSFKKGVPYVEQFKIKNLYAA